MCCRRWAACVLLVSLSACGRRGVPPQPYAVEDGDSINGIGIFIGMLEQRGYTVETAPRLSDDLDADLVFCFDRYHIGLSDTSFDALLEYSEGGEGPRSVFYVAPGYRNDRTFWEGQFETFPDRDLSADQKRAFLASQPDFMPGVPLHSVTQTPLPDPGFSMLRDPYLETDLMPVPLARSWQVEGFFDVLYEAEQVPYAVIHYNQNENDVLEGLVLFANAYPFMNFALVDQANREALKTMLDDFDYGDRVVVIGFPFSGESAPKAQNSIVDMLGVFPISVIAAQGLALLALFFWSRAPIIGYGTRSLREGSTSFSDHIQAFGRHLQRSARPDVAFALIARFLWRDPDPKTVISEDEAIEEIQSRMESS